MTVISARNTTLVLKGTEGRVEIRVRNSAGELVDAEALRLQVYDPSETLLFEDDLVEGFGDPPNGTTEIVRTSEGVYYFPFGDTDIDTANSTTSTGEYLFHWTADDGESEPVQTVQLVQVVSGTLMRLVPKLKLIIDKAAKVVDENPEDPRYLGYSEAMCIQFLEGGLSWINGFQPYPVWNSVEEFPAMHWRILLDAAVVDALTSQELFAVDTDVQYTDNGNSFFIDHQPKLTAILNATWARLKETVPPMKKQYLMSGSAHVQAGPGFRFQTMLDASPKGNLFRNMFVT